MKRNQLASWPETAPWRETPTEKPKLPSLENGQVAPSWTLGTWDDVSTMYIIDTQRWSGEWTGDEFVAPSLQPEGDCIDRTGSPCPKLAEARARQALAERQFIELNHRMANVLQILVARIEWQRRIQDDRIRHDELESLLASVQASAQLHQCLLPPRLQINVDLGALLTNMAAAIEGVTGLRCHVEAEPVDLPGDVAAHLAAAVNELAWNAYKHAYGGRKGGALRIVCRRDADLRLWLSVADQGCGLAPDFDPRTREGLGLKLVCATMRELGGKLRVESGRGACFTLLLNIPRVSTGRE